MSEFNAVIAQGTDRLRAIYWSTAVITQDPRRTSAPKVWDFGQNTHVEMGCWPTGAGCREMGLSTSIDISRRKLTDCRGFHLEIRDAKGRGRSVEGGI